jgi:NADPH:quinone reductase-like Zn-dependent oxidoreductase
MWYVIRLRMLEDLVVSTTAVSRNETMKAIVQDGYGSADVLHLRDVELPAAGEDGVLVRVRAASINAADWHMLGRLAHVIGFLMRVPIGRIRGGDLAGIVEAVGKSVTRFKPGDEVFGVGRGSFAEFAVAPERGLAPKPRSLTFAEAAALPIAGVTALQGLRDPGQVKPGQRVLVYGAGGGVGTLAVQIAKALGAHVTAVSRTRNLDVLRSIGVDAVIDYTNEDFTRCGRRFDVVFDLGANRSLADCRRVLASDGRLVLAGAASSLGKIVMRLLGARLLSRANGQRIASFLARVNGTDLETLKELADAGKLSPVVDRQYPLSRVPDALRYVGTRQAVGKVVIQV